MRTTIDIADDVLQSVKQRAREEHRTAGAVLTDLARQALTAEAPQSTGSFLGFEPLPKRPGVVVTNDLVNQLRDEEGM